MQYVLANDKFFFSQSEKKKLSLRGGGLPMSSDRTPGVGDIGGHRHPTGGGARGLWRIDFGADFFLRKTSS